MKRILILALALSAAGVYAKPKTMVRWPVKHTEISARFDVGEHAIVADARLTIPRKGAKKAGFIINSGFTVDEVRVGGETVSATRVDSFEPGQVSGDYGVFGEWSAGDGVLYIADIPKAAKKQKPLLLEVAYHGTLYSPPDEREFSRERIAFEVSGTIGEDGIYLSPSAWWYPRLPDCIGTHTVTARLPQGWNCVTDGTPSEPQAAGDGVEVTHTAETISSALSFSAGPYVVKKREHNGVLVATYFLPPQAGLADNYLDACERYLDMYGDLLAPYPFTKFAVVDNFLPSGYGMPGWTLLGSEVLRLPFIKDISLGHEVLHNWFGNSLFVDYREGNWCEGLTTYLADYKYKEDADSAAAVQYRMNVLRDYGAYVTAEKDYPISRFSERAGPADRAIGYGKVMMVFHMLRRMLDQVQPDMFQQVLAAVYNQYQWQPVGWEVWRKEFERRLGQRLDWFFEQWIKNSGAPRISMTDMEVTQEPGVWNAHFTILTESGARRPFNYLLQIRGVSNVGPVDYPVFVQTDRQPVKISGPGELQALVLDPAYDVFRRLYPGEVPITLADFMGDAEGVLVYPAKVPRSKQWEQVAEGLKGEGQTVIKDTGFGPKFKARPLWILGGPEENAAWDKIPPDPRRLKFLPHIDPRWKEEEPVPAGLEFQGREFRGGKYSATIIDRHPKTPDKTIVYTLVLPDADPVSATRKLPHYGKYSYLLFDGDTNVDKGVWAVSGESPMTWRAGGN